MLEVVAHEHGPERPRRQGVGQVEAARLDEADVSRELRADVAQVARPSLPGVDVSDEIAHVAGDVEDRRGRIDPALQVADDLGPDPVLLLAGYLGEAVAIDVVEPVHHVRPASTSARIQGMTSSSISSRRRRRLEAEHAPGLLDVGDAHLDVVLEGRVGDVPERLVRPVDLPPDQLGQLEHRRRAAVERLKSSLSAVGRLDRQADAPGQVAAVGVVADLAAVAEDVQRVLALEHLLHEVGDDVAHRQLDVAAHDVRVADGPPLADADAVERADDRVGQPVLLPGALGEVLGRELLEAVGRERRRAAALLALGGREDRRRSRRPSTSETTVIFSQPAARGGPRSRRRRPRRVIRSFSASRS